MEQKNKTIGFQITNLYDEYPTPLLPGIEDAVRKRGYNLIVFPGETPNSPHGYLYQSNVIYNHIHSGNISGLVMASGTICNYLTREEFKDFYSRFSDIPVSSISIPVPGCPSVLVENRTGMELLTEHLIHHHGYRKIAFIRGPENNEEAKVRFETFLEVLEKNGIEFNKDLLVDGDFEEESGEDAVKTLLANKQKFEALIASNDMMAFGAIRELNAHGIKVPKDVAVCGFDDLTASRYFTPPLTTVHQPLYKQAMTAAHLVLDCLEGKKAPEVTILPTELVIRTSCGCLPDSVSLSEFHDHQNSTGNSKRGFSKVERKKINRTIHQKLQELSLAEEHADEIVKKTEQFRFILESKILQRQTSAKFLYELQDIVNDEIMAGKPVELWKTVLSICKEIIGSMLEGTESTDNWNLLFHKAMILVGTAMQREQAISRLSLERRVFIMREVIQRLVSTLYLDELMDIIRNELPKFGMTCIYVVSYQKSIPHTARSKWIMPAHQELLLAFDKQKSVPDLRRHTVDFKSDRLIPEEYLPAGRNYTLIVHPLFFMEDQLGYIVYETKEIVKSVHEILTSQISSAFKSALLFHAREKTEIRLRETLLELEDYNLKLKSLAQKDELTGLYNRRGFLALTPQQMHLAQRMGKSGILFYIDLDGLKKINDTFGHEEGDVAIHSASGILKLAFRTMDIVARLGGDEFTAFTVNTDKAFIEVFVQRLNQLLDDYNNNSGKKYRLSLSFGYTIFTPETRNDIPGLLKEADNMLYKIKNAKKLG